jgi:three-Cys-motif partner protein
MVTEKLGGGYAREWGPWSVWKTEVLLGGYLPLFAKAAERGIHRTFIDCFAGSTINLERDTGRAVASSPRIALGVNPQFTHFLLFERPRKAEQLEKALKSEFPDRSIRVIPGDCNAEIDKGLIWLSNQGSGDRYGPHLGPAIAYLDPDKLDLGWSTVIQLASYFREPQHQGQYVRPRPIELLILFPTGPLKRALPQPPRMQARPSVVSKVGKFFGTEEWQRIYDAQRAEKITGENSWLWYLDLYRCRLMELGYHHTSAIEVCNTKKVVLYHMVFATAHVAGQNIMAALQEEARRKLPQMINEERRRRLEEGAPCLFPQDDATLNSIAENPSQFARLLNEKPKRFEWAYAHPTVKKNRQTNLFEQS